MEATGRGWRRRRDEVIELFDLRRGAADQAKP